MTRRGAKWLRVGLLVSAVVAMIFALRLAVLILGWGPDPARPIEGWMTPRYVVRVYDLPPEDVSRVLGLSPGTAPRLTLERIAETQGRPLAQVLADLDALRPQP